MSECAVYQRDSYTTDFDYIVARHIVEYDMKDAGFNLIKYFNLLPKSKIAYLEGLEKHRRTIQIGIYMGADIDFNKELTASFGKLRKLFVEENSIKDEDIVSIKKDAIFLVDKDVEQTSFGNVVFARKHTYSSFHKFDNIEMYYNRKDSVLDVKGISDDLLYQHNKFLKVLKRLFGYLEVNDHEQFVELMKNFSIDYKECKLSYPYYRELNSESLFALKPHKGDSRRYYIPDIGNSDFDDELDISYNYINFILPLIQRFYFE